MSKFAFRYLFVCVALMSTNLMAMQVPAPNIIDTGHLHISSSSGSAGGPFNGVNVNQDVGAERFYNAGFDGTLTTVGNIEAGHVDNGHETLGHVTTQITGTGATGALDSHATWVTHSMSGTLATDTYPANYYGFGIAKGSTTISGAIATSISGSSFGLTTSSVASVYSEMTKAGAQGVIAGANVEVDVFNSSWGFTEPTGFNTLTIGVDGLINDTGKVAVFSAGNSGPGANTVGGIGAGYNSITVGALGSDTAPIVYDSVSSFSSRSPNDFRDLDPDTTVAGVRAAVDIAAPGQNLTLANDGTTNSYNTGLQGTSFAAPIVAGGAALVVDAGKTLYSGNASAIDGRVVKSVLMNSASKITGWNNGQALNAGVLETTQSLDWSSGAGKLDLDQAFEQYVSIGSGGMAETLDVAGTAQGDLGNVGVVGWDFGFVGSNDGVDDSNFYFLNSELEAGTDLTVTLTWFADMISGSDANFAGASADHLANLDLRIFEFDNLTDRNILGETARSISLYNVSEHLHFAIDATGFYGIQVDYTGAQYDFGALQTGEFYGLSWFGTATVAIPEVSSSALFAIALFGPLARRRRR